MNTNFLFAEERCVICGAVVPEGRQVCPMCEQDVNSAPVQMIDWQRGIPAPSLMCRIGLWFREAFGR